ncbi:FecR family protein [Steroidobacter sp.]|uniref:FecR family protein n=1 Tax=Steroidobacter sp. TaxID=1978227 RepID=UPI001A631A0B|nr:FecR domain-containing protein [Steroidobacter sp.]MBL8268806.1 FecR domain-containing protein [Steroidobacter sp.]
MDKHARDTSSEPSEEILAQAAAWIASLHDADRTEKFEAGFRRWLAADPRHRTAFEMANELWVDAESWPKSRAPETAPHSRVGFAWRPSPAFLVVACMALVALLWGGLQFRDPALTTHVGEQRSLTLQDGSRVSLNTDTRIKIHYDDKRRRVSVESGEALFEVAKRPDWPFVVVVGDREVTALGTVFVVRRESEKTSVLLMEGKVRVVSLASGTQAQHSSQPAVLEPGQRLTVVTDDVPTIDRPVIPTVVAWQRGQVIFDHTPLGQAVSEMNRYSPVKLRLDNEPAASFLVTGIFRAGDTESFVQAVTESYQMTASSGEREILLKGGRDAEGF